MTTITDDDMHRMRAAARTYTLVILKAGPHWDDPGARAIVWEHGRRNFVLRADGLLSIVCPVVDDSEVAGIGIFNATPDETHAIMEDDPGVKAGILVYELHPCRGFPGDSLPA